MNASEWARAAALIAELWPHRPLPPESLQAWFDLLADLDGHAVAAAIRQHALESEWPPSLAEIRRRCQPPARPWEDALAAMKRGDTGADDPALAEVVGFYGGWTVIGQWPLVRWEDPVFRAQFRDTYTAAQQRIASGQQRALALDAGMRPVTRGGSPKPVGALTREAIGGS